MKNKLLIALLSATSIYACDYNYDGGDDECISLRQHQYEFIQAKTDECMNMFNSTRRKELEYFFVENINRLLKEKVITSDEVYQQVINFNERLFDDLLAFCSKNYGRQPYSVNLIYSIGRIKIKDRLMERLLN